MKNIGTLLLIRCWGSKGRASNSSGKISCPSWPLHDPRVTSAGRARETAYASTGAPTYPTLRNLPVGWTSNDIWKVLRQSTPTTPSWWPTWGTKRRSAPWPAWAAPTNVNGTALLIWSYSPGMYISRPLCYFVNFIFFSRVVVQIPLLENVFHLQMGEIRRIYTFMHQDINKLYAAVRHISADVSYWQRKGNTNCCEGGLLPNLGCTMSVRTHKMW